MAVVFAHAAGISSYQNGPPGHEKSVSQGSVRPRRSPKAVTGPAQPAACHWPSLIVEPSPGPIGPAQVNAQVPGAMRGGTVFHRDRSTCGWIDMRWLREAVGRACRNSAYGVVT